MAKVIAGMTMSLDGFVADETGSAGPLYQDLAALRGTAYMNEETSRTGAVIMGKRAFEMGDPDSCVGNYEFQVPIFRAPPPPTFSRSQAIRASDLYVRDGRRRIGGRAGNGRSRRQGSPGDRRRQCNPAAAMHARLVDDLHLDVMPVLLGAGLRFFENSGVARWPLRRSTCKKMARTSLRFRVKKEDKNA